MANPAFHGRFLWQELRSRDPDAAAAFYGRVLDWKSQPFAPGVPYTVFTAGQNMVAGATRLDDEAAAAGLSPQWVGSIGSADVDATVAQAVQLGARVLEAAADMPNVGRTALLADPQGALFGVFKPAREPGSSGAFSWHELAARHLEPALGFYQALFGWQVLQRMNMGPEGTYVIFGRNGQQEGGIYAIPAGRPQQPAWLPYAHHQSADQAAKAAVAAGGKIANGPMDVPGGGRIAQLIDPHGIMFAVHSMAVAAKTPPGKPAASKPAASKPPAAKPPAAKPAAAKKAVAKPARRSKRKVARKAKRSAVARKRAAKPARKVVRKVVRKVARKVARKVRRVAKRAKRVKSKRGAARKK